MRHFLNISGFAYNLAWISSLYQKLIHFQRIIYIYLLGDYLCSFYSSLVWAYKHHVKLHVSKALSRSSRLSSTYFTQAPILTLSNMQSIELAFTMPNHVKKFTGHLSIIANQAMLCYRDERYPPVPNSTFGRVGTRIREYQNEIIILDLS